MGGRGVADRVVVVVGERGVVVCVCACVGGGGGGGGGELGAITGCH